MGDLAGPALRTFFNIARRWQLTEEQQMAILDVERQQLHDAKLAELASTTTGTTMTRISLVLGIFRAINILLPVPERADGWVREPNRARLFGGRRPVDLIASGRLADLWAVRRYLDAQQVAPDL